MQLISLYTLSQQYLDLKQDMLCACATDIQGCSKNHILARILVYLKYVHIYQKYEFGTNVLGCRL